MMNGAIQKNESDVEDVPTPHLQDSCVISVQLIDDETTAGIECVQDLSAAGSASKPQNMKSLESIQTPNREKRTLVSERSCTPSTQSSSDSCDSDIANYIDSETIQLADQNSSDSNRVIYDDEDDRDTEVCNNERTRSGRGFRSFLSDLMGAFLSSAEDVSDVLTPDNKDRAIDTEENIYSRNEALELWKHAKRDLEETYAEVDESGNDKFDTTTFFEKSVMFKEKTAKMEKKRGCTKRLSKKQGDSLNRAQEQKLKKLMMTLSLHED